MRCHGKGLNAQGQIGAGQAGFSMVEMLMTAFILAIGILGLTMLQVMSLQASRGSRSMTTAVMIAEAVMDRAEMEGRLSWLNLTDTNSATASLADLPELRYITIPGDGRREEFFNSKGGDPVATSADPAESQPRYTVTTTRAPFDAVVTGALSDFTVTVAFSDAVNQNNEPVRRTVRLTRRIAHG